MADWKSHLKGRHSAWDLSVNQRLRLSIFLTIFCQVVEEPNLMF